MVNNQSADEELCGAFKAATLQLYQIVSDMDKVREEIKRGMMTAEEQIVEVERQIRECCRGDAFAINCPYCGAVTESDSTALCCDLMGQAVKAVLYRMQMQDQFVRAARIAEAVARN